ncbi:MAG: Rieske (2Fe-2S) protein [Myxococcales bacterium]|nr:Rieske (2Fe-2S) protein [Myxococcales bacterium]
MTDESQQGRRNFLRAAAGLGSAALGLLLALPGASYVVDPLLRASGKKGRWLPVAELEGLEEEHPVSVSVVGEQRDAWTRAPQRKLGMVWLRKKGEQVVAFNAECPHLGCKVGYDRDQKHFACPCHESAFNQDGDVQGGPAPRSLDPLETRVVDGKVEVRFVRFRAQTAERVEIG